MKLNIDLKILSVLMILLITRTTYAQTGFVQQDAIKVSGITTDDQVAALSVTGKQTTRVYYDGLGRPLQTLAVQASPLGNDIIQPVEYNTLGQQTKSYLPYAGQGTDVQGSYRTNALSGAQASFYNNTSQYVVPTDDDPWAQQVFENSPLQRILQAGMVGDGFQPGLTGSHYKTVAYRPNNSSTDGSILQWNPDGTYSSSTYSNNSLAVTDGTNEDGMETLSFTDISGHLILKRQKTGSGGNSDTYYIYNNAGMINYIVPPGAVALLAANSYNLSTAPLSTLVFHYVYDSMGRPVEKTVPAKGTVYIVYDPMNRPVLIQDAVMRGNNQWNYIKYDGQGRAISQGIYTDATYTYRVNTGGTNGMQDYVNSLASSYSSAWFETRAGTITNSGYYTNNIFPTSNIVPLAYSYFDDYDLNMDGTPDYSYASQSLSGEVGATISPLKGVPTIISRTTVGSGLSGTWLTSVIFYDKRGNPIQTQSNNQVYYLSQSTLTDTKTTVPDFTGVPQISKVSKQSGASTTTTVLTSFTYDAMYRVQTISQQYNNSGVTMQVAAYTYNEMGQLIKKGLGLTGSSYLQNVDMRYNIRGQLLSINNSKLSNDGGVTNNDSNDLFGMQFVYDQSDSNIGNSPSYSGNLSAVKWISKDASGNAPYERSYKYTYDPLNRLTAANYAERTATSTGSFNSNTNGFDEYGISYDANGNLLSLLRNSASGIGATSSFVMDNLTYSYDPNNPNQLHTVTDASGNAGGAGFQVYSGGNSSGYYQYDANGNLTVDPYKALNIGYNVLNRTDQISFTAVSGRYIQYTYDATGSMIRKQAFDSGGTTTTDYVDGFVYTNGALNYFQMPEGRVLLQSGVFKQEFILTDQQGNARIAFQDNGSGTAVVKQESSFYAFGGQLPTSVTGGDNKKLYNGGAEWQNDFSNLPDYQQTFFRNYDAALGRWIAVDPEAESAESMTSYQYAANNPIMLNDPLGNKADPYGFTPSPSNIAADVDFPGLARLLNATADYGVGGDSGAFWDSAISFAADVLDGMNNGSASQAHFSGNDFAMGASTENAISQGYIGSASLDVFANGAMGISYAPSMASSDSKNNTGVSTVLLNGSYYLGANQEGYFNYLDPSSIRLAYGTKGPDLTPMYFANFRLPSEFNNRLPFAIKIGGQIRKSVNVNLAQISIGINIKQIQKLLEQIGIDGVENTIAYSFDAAGKAVNAALISGIIQNYDNRAATDLFLNTFQSGMRSNFRANDIGVYPGYTVPGAPISVLQFIPGLQ